MAPPEIEALLFAHVCPEGDAPHLGALLQAVGARLTEQDCGLTGGWALVFNLLPQQVLAKMSTAVLVRGSSAETSWLSGADMVALVAKEYLAGRPHELLEQSSATLSEARADLFGRGGPAATAAGGLTQANVQGAVDHFTELIHVFGGMLGCAYTRAKGPELIDGLRALARALKLSTTRVGVADLGSLASALAFCVAVPQKEG
jgi:hypothetical protein